MGDPGHRPRRPPAQPSSNIRRPPANPSSNITCQGTVINQDLQDAARDEEALREEQRHLGAVVAALRREGSEIRERLRAADLDNNKKDKLMQELLSSAKGGAGVSGEVLDQLREDLQLLLQVKKRNQEARQHLEDKEGKLAAIQHELKVTNVGSMEEDVADAKAEAKAKAQQWAEANGGDRDGNSREAKELLDRMAAVERDITKSQREIAKLEDKCSDLRDEEDRQRSQIETLQSKRQEVEKQAEQCRSRLEDLAGIDETHEQLMQGNAERHEKLKQLRAQQREVDKAAAAKSSGAGCKVNPDFLTKQYHPVKRGQEDLADLLLWRLRRALENTGCSGIDALTAQDSDSDGRLTASELSAALSELHVPNADKQAVQGLIKALDPALKHDGNVAIAELVLSLPLIQPPPGPTDEQLLDALEKMAWSCRRRGMDERQLRLRVAGLLIEDSTQASINQRAARLCEELGVPDVGETLGQALEIRGEEVATLMPSWTNLSGMGRVSLLIRFVREVALHRDSITPLLLVGDHLDLHGFLKVRDLLGSHWSNDDLRHVALMAQPAPSGSSAPVVDAERLARAANPGGLKAEFEAFFLEFANEIPDIGRILEEAASGQEAKVPAGAGLGWLREALRACEAAASGNQRRATPAEVERVVSSSRPVSASPAPGGGGAAAAAAAQAPAAAAPSQQPLAWGAIATPTPAAPQAAPQAPAPPPRPLSAKSPKPAPGSKSPERAESPGGGGGYSEEEFDEVEEEEDTQWEDDEDDEN